ncbi:MAG: sigma 54-interacting transcriptional regulator [Candidatus Electrothrix sp. GW3-4]|uniref:sigma-54-dependent Fis family transcriptional regulator n=1 Tax=Candidatus Electrothrix sp. GW3-4 TaxID=3126740 RepID=UPI0030CF1BC0
MDENEFFREATLRICGNLEIEKALFFALKYMRQVMPVDHMFFQFYDEEHNAMHILADASPECGRIVDLQVKLSVGARQELMQFREEFRHKKSKFVWLFRDNPRKQKLTDEIFNSLGYSTTSLMVFPLGLKFQELLGGGSLILSSESESKFSQQHVELLSLVREPFAIALSNALKHRSELKLYDRDFFWEITTRICGNLEIEEGLRSCLELLSQYMPADSLYLERHERNFGAMHMIARATADKSEKMDVLIPFTEEGKAKMAMLAQEWIKGTLPSVLVINNPREEPVTKHLLKTLGEPPSSVMSLPLFLKEEIAGALVVIAEGDNRFTEQHAKLYSNLRMPFFVAVSNTLKHREIIKLKDLLADDNRYLQGELRRLSGDEIVGANFGLRDVMYKVQQVAALNSPVLLLGETGVGKDVIAQTIHYSSSRSDGPFVSVNCGAIPESLIDSELFGHEEGAFTGAITQKRGRFERANKGTIFLDEIGELPLQAQVRLLRVLQSKEIERVGGVETIPLDIRIIAATNRNLEKMVAQNTFREDLWFRLNVFPIQIPPLRERKEDIPALLQYFIRQKTKELNLPAVPSIFPGAIDFLLSYSWPGNVRELGNIVERAMILNSAGPLTFDHLNPVDTKTNTEEISSHQKEQALDLDSVISRHIRSVLSQTDGKVNGEDGAAALLGVNPSTLRNRMKKLGIPYGKQRYL